MVIADVLKLVVWEGRIVRSIKCICYREDDALHRLLWGIQRATDDDLRDLYHSLQS